MTSEKEDNLSSGSDKESVQETISKTEISKENIDNSTNEDVSDSLQKNNHNFKSDTSEEGNVSKVENSKLISSQNSVKSSELGKKKKRILQLDSDSEEDNSNTFSQMDIETVATDDVEETPKNYKKKRVLKIDSDSEEEMDDKPRDDKTEDADEPFEKNTILKKKDSDFEEEMDKPKEDTSEGSNNKKIVKKRVLKKIDSDSEEEMEKQIDDKLEETNATVEQEKKKSFYNYDPDIYDAEESEEETTNQDGYKRSLFNYDGSADEMKHRDKELEENNLKRKKMSKKKNEKELKPERKAAKAAKEEMKLIQSESARMLRESRVSLPYHKPRQRTLTEFLQRKKTPLQVNSVKVSQEQLVIVSKILEERHKDIEEFYKSEDEEPEESEQANSQKLNNTQEIEMNIPLNEEENIEQKSSENNEIPTANLMSNLERCDTDNISQTTEHSVLLFEDSQPNESSNLIISKDSILTENIQITNDLRDENIPSNLDNKDDSFDKNIEKENDKENLPAKENENTLANSIINTEENKNESLDVTSEKSIDNVLSNDSKDDSLDSSLTISKSQKSCKDNNPRSQLLSRLLDIKSNNVRPRLSGGPNEIIDLMSPEKKKQNIGVLKLKQLFLKHSSVTPKANPKVTVDISVMSAEKTEDDTIVDIKHETIKVNLGENDISNLLDNDVIPGAKHTILREDLRQRIARQRNAEWAEREAKKKLDENELEVDETMKDTNNDDNFLDDDNEEELTDQETTDEELEEDDVLMREKKRNKSIFVDEEADESDTMEVEENDADSEKELDQDESENEDEDEDIDDDSNKNQTEKESDSDKEKKSHKIDEITPKKKAYLRLKSMDMFDDDESNERVPRTPGDDESNLMASIPIQAHQPHQNGLTQPVAEQTPFARPFPPGHSIISPLCTISPFAQRNKINEASPKVGEFSSSYPETSPTGIPELGVGRISKTTASQPSNFAHVHKQLFRENSQESNELIGLCSGKFTSDDSKSTDIEESNELIGLCSGKFSSDDSKSTQIDELIGLCSGQEFLTPSLSSEHKTDKISDPINEPEEEREEEKEKNHFQLRILDSDEEEDLLEKMNSNKKKVRRINFSDEESDDDKPEKVDDEVKEDDDTNSEDDVNSVDGDANSINIDEHSNNENEFDYDSEENEIPKANKPQDFIDEEAELSDSDLGSADEDERDLDRFEAEAGDADHHDQDELKEQLGKIHLRRVLDDDQREVRLIQEMLLEDGELHSEEPGRERKFRWKDIDMKFDLNGTKNEDGEQALGSDDENDTEWRKMRMEREAFLEKDSENADEEDDSLFLKMGKAALSKLRSSNLNSTSTPSNSKEQENLTNSKDLVTSPDPKNPFKQVVKKRGSFLSRGEAALAKLACLTGMGTTNKNGHKVANSAGRNFVFSTVRPSDEDQNGNQEMESEVVTPSTEANEDKRKKRKQTQQETPPLVKRLRFNDDKFKKKSIFAKLSLP